MDGVYVNGHGPYRFLVDTGTNVNLIETGLARKIGMNATFKVDFASAAGKTQMSGSDDNEVTLDPAKADAQKFFFSGLESIHNLNPDVQGVLGQWFLSRFDYSIDLRGKRLEFGKQERNGTRVKFAMLNGRMLVPSSLGNLVLDSGASRLVLFGVESDGGVDNRGRVRTLTGSQAIGTASRKLVIEARNIWRGDAVTMQSRTEPGVAGLLPLGLFKVTYVCNSEGYVIFE
ncbi:MAG TPA: retropepsin-like aspartic protease [Bryobacteraceae bacterium]|nr:retropepsin-like aspartic protease [Bryobacteraceae bacterium]